VPPTRRALGPGRPLAATDSLVIGFLGRPGEMEGQVLNKMLAGLVMGIVVAILCSIVFGIGSGAGEAGAKRGLWTALAGFVVTFVLALSAARGRYAWGRGFLLCGLLCFALPLASMAFSGIVGAEKVSTASSDAARAGAALGTAMAGTAMALVSGIVGFFLGLIFLVSSYFSLRSA